MNLSEKQIEDVFEIFYKQLISSELTFVKRQHILENGLRVDLLFNDNKNKKVVVELKRDAITREDIGQTLQYAGLIRDSRVILAAPIISSSIKIAFDHYGIEYLEFDLKEIGKLYEQIKDKPKTEQLAKQITVPINVVAEPLENRTRKDGSIAFKVTYVDKEWSGVCSHNVAQYNFEHRTWCGIQKDHKINCQSKVYENPENINENHYPCFDSIALKHLKYFSGYDHGPKKEGNYRRCLEAKVGKLALFTSREPGEPESERFIFAIGIIESILPPNTDDFTCEEFKCDKGSALIFNKNNYPKFWKYYRNANNPDRLAWNTGLFRYVTDNVILNLLTDISTGNRYSSKTKEKAQILIDTVL